MIQGEPPYGWTGGFIPFPGGTYQEDPTGVIMLIGEGDIGTQAQPTLTGHGGTPSYDLAQRRWLPAGPGQAAPDGSSYAYGSYELGGTHFNVLIVDVASARISAVTLNPPDSASGNGWQVDDYNGRYVYLVATQIDQFPKGVWRLDPRTGALSELLPTSAGNVLRVEGGVAWVGRVDPTDPSPPTPGKGQGFDTIESINLSTGAHTTWIYKKSQAVIFWGLDSSSHPVVMVTSAPDFAPVISLLLIDAPGGDGIAIPAGFLPLGTMEPDNGRLWFGGPQGIYYWTAATGLHQVYDFEVDPSLQEMMIPAGHCV